MADMSNTKDKITKYLDLYCQLFLEVDFDEVVALFDMLLTFFQLSYLKKFTNVN